VVKIIVDREGVLCEYIFIERGGRMKTNNTEGGRMNLTLQHDINVDIDGGYWEKPIDKKNMVVSVGSVEEAVNTFIAWRDRNGLGGGNMTRESGKIYTEGGDFVARISYNGRVWDKPETF